MTAPLGVYGAALRQAAQGRDGVLHVVDEASGHVRRIDPRNWTTSLRPGDDSVLARCVGPTLDVGCGPGRVTAALTRTGHNALGIDISAEAVRQARGRGAAALRADVFGPVPNAGGWQRVLLADGNIGIGGDPVALLKRCLDLMGPRGGVLVEVAPPGDRSWIGHVRLRYAQRQSAPFPWASVSADDIAAVAERAGLSVHDRWTEGQRWFVHLAR
jgi:SAM-dependent methyltransferase